MLNIGGENAKILNLAQKLQHSRQGRNFIRDQHDHGWIWTILKHKFRHKASLNFVYLSNYRQSSLKFWVQCGQSSYKPLVQGFNCLNVKLNFSSNFISHDASHASFISKTSNDNDTKKREEHFSESVRHSYHPIFQGRFAYSPDFSCSFKETHCFENLVFSHEPH